MKGSGSSIYTLKNSGGVYSCTCPAWRNQSLGIERRTCKHLRAYRGDEAETKRLTNGVGVDVAYDSVGKDTFAKSLNCTRRRGLVCLYGMASGPVPLFEVQTLAGKGSLFLTRMKLGDYIATRAELLERSGAVFGAVASGKLKIEIGGEFALKDASEAHRKLGGRETTGKLVLLP